MAASSNCLAFLVLVTLVALTTGGHSHANSRGRTQTYRPNTNNPQSCAWLGQCCPGQDGNCKVTNRGPACFCDEYCIQNDDCCLDYFEYCRGCEGNYTNVHGKCLKEFGNNTYYYADRTCKDDGARLFMPQTKAYWEAFISSDYYHDLAYGKSEFKYWIHCKYVNGAMRWQDSPRPGTPVTWTNFTAPPTQGKKAGLVGAGDFDGDWIYSKQWKNLTTICEK